VGSITGLATGIATWLATPSSANLLAALTTKTGTGNAVFGSAPTIDSLNATTAMTLAFLTGSTQCLQVNTSGTVSGTGAACGGSGSSGANPTATASDTAVNGVATTFMRSDAAPAIQKTSASVFGLAKVDGTTITATAGVISAVGGGATGANPTATAGPTAVNGSATTFMRSDGAPAIQLGTGSAPGLVQCGLGLTCTSGVASSAVTQRNNTTTSDTLIASDAGTVVTENNASAVAVGIAQAGTTGFASGQYWTLKNKGAGTVTLTPTTSTIDGSATLTLSQNQSIDFYSDGTNYGTLPGRPTGGSTTPGGSTGQIQYNNAGAFGGFTQSGDCTTVTSTGVITCTKTSGTAFGALATATPGTGVATAAAAALSANGGLTGTIASGTAVLGTSAIASGACATVVTVSATNVATTDTVSFGYNSDPTAVTGYGASATGAVLSIYPYPTANNVNVKVCNSSSASITPSAMTLNFRVVR
jgi:hypothetical protein